MAAKKKRLGLNIIYTVLISYRLRQSKEGAHPDKRFDRARSLYS